MVALTPATTQHSSSSASARSGPGAADVADPKGIRTLFDAAERHYGRLDVLVHSVAGFVRGPLTAATDRDYLHTFSLNARATFVALREAGRAMRDGGQIVFISSAATRVDPQGEALYAASKAAGEHLVRGAARELGARRLTVNSVLPEHHRRRRPVLTHPFTRPRSTPRDPPE